jgi:hypothetical protein
MKIEDPLLQIQFDGKAVGASRMPVSHLLTFLSNMEKAIKRTSRVLSGEVSSLQTGRVPENIKKEIALDLVQITHASPSAVLGLERNMSQAAFPGMDHGTEIIEKSIQGLGAAQEERDTLPDGFDTGVLMAWRNAGKLFEKGIDSITFTLNHRTEPIVTKYTYKGFSRIQERIKGPETNIRTIEGRLLMADFKEYGTRCRIHPSFGEPVLCYFDEEQRDEVLEDILQYVKIIGEATEDPLTGKISSINIHDIERLEEKEDEAADLLPKKTPLSHDFWKSPSLEELAESQHVQPVTDLSTLLGSWPGELNDGFEESIDDLRHHFAEGDY